MRKGKGICARLFFGHVSSCSLVETAVFFIVYYACTYVLTYGRTRAVTRSESP